jgi:uncharacterized damage-inducible protein DinB
MTLSEKLSKELTQVLSGDAWYGPPVYKILEKVSFDAAYEKPARSAHNVAGMVLHMLSWTEEVIDRMNGMTAQTPSSGDWPDPGAPDEEKWQQYVSDLKLVNVNLTGVIQNFPEEQWNEPILDERSQVGTVITHEELVRGLIQHHIYHSAQIALLSRIIG